MDLYRSAPPLQFPGFPGVVMKEVVILNVHSTAEEGADLLRFLDGVTSSASARFAYSSRRLSSNPK